MRTSNILQRWSWLTLVLSFGLAACAPVQMPAQDSASPTPEQSQSTEVPAEVAVTPLPSDALPGAPRPLATVVPTEAPVIGEIPADVMEQVMGDLEQRAGVQRTALNVIRSEAVIWSDGSLGCPQPGVMYTQETIDGYWVVLQGGGATYDYRVDGRRNRVTLCEPGQPAGGLYSDELPPTAVILVPGQALPSVTPVQP